MSEEGYGKEVDWWSIGCIIYELVTGLPPFSFDDRDLSKLYKKIINTNPEFPSYLSEECKDIICRLLEKDP